MFKSLTEKRSTVNIQNLKFCKRDKFWKDYKHRSSTKIHRTRFPEK